VTVPSIDQKGYAAFSAQLQKTAEKVVKTVGGYWPPQNTLAAIAQRLGFAASSVSGQTTPRPFDNALFDAIWLAACIANQYCVDLGHVSKSHWASRSFETIAEGLLAILRQRRREKTMVLLEHTAGQGTALGATFGRSERAGSGIARWTFSPGVSGTGASCGEADAAAERPARS